MSLGPIHERGYPTIRDYVLLGKLGDCGLKSKGLHAGEGRSEPQIHDNSGFYGIRLGYVKLYGMLCCMVNLSRTAVLSLIANAAKLKLTAQ
jgi:hypothetical protein